MKNRRIIQTKLLSGALLCLVCASITAQYREATDAQRQAIVEKMRQTSDGMQTMQCDFVQVKELSFMNDKITSEGKMYYQKANKIRWEYVKPYQYVFVADGQNIRMTQGNQTTQTSIRSSKLFGAISRVMIGGVSGSGLIDSPDFTTQLTVGKDDCKIELTPLKKEMKELFASIQLYVTLSDGRVRQVALLEKSGDKTIITLQNIKINAPVDDRLFAN